MHNTCQRYRMCLHLLFFIRFRLDLLIFLEKLEKIIMHLLESISSKKQKIISFFIKLNCYFIIGWITLSHFVVTFNKRLFIRWIQLIFIQIVINKVRMRLIITLSFPVEVIITSKMPGRRVFPNISTII
jgi:hypothetical protein